MHKECAVGILLMLGLLTVQASAQAPGDEDDVCITLHPYRNDWHVLTDTFNYLELVGTSGHHVWQVRDFDGTGIGVSLLTFETQF